MIKKICLNCGSDNYYAKKLCRNCYNRYLRTNCKTPEEFVDYEKRNDGIAQKKSKIKAITSVIKFSYTDLGERCGVTREFARQWFSPVFRVPDKYVESAYSYILEQAIEAINILNDFS